MSGMTRQLVTSYWLFAKSRDTSHCQEVDGIVEEIITRRYVTIDNYLTARDWQRDAGDTPRCYQLSIINKFVVIKLRSTVL